MVKSEDIYNRVEEGTWETRDHSHYESVQTRFECVVLPCMRGIKVMVRLMTRSIMRWN